MSTFMKTLIVSTLMLASGLASADTLMPNSGNAWTLYVFGNGEVIKNTLMAIAAMVNEAPYRNLLSLIATIGVIALGARAGFDPKQAPKLIGYFAGVYLTMYVLLSLDANIEVNDPVSLYTDVVTGVPAAVGVPAAFISNIGHWLTENVEKNFSMPSDNLTLTGGGAFDMANSLARDAAQVRIIDPYLRQGMSYYMVDCVMPMIVSGAVSSADILSTNDLWGLVQGSNPGILTQYFSGTHQDGALLTCPDAYAQLTNDLATHAPTLIKAAGSAWHANNLNLEGYIQSAYSWLSDNVANGTGAKTVQQAATIHLLNDSFEQAAAMTGNNEMVMSISLAQAKQTQKSQWFSASQLFKDMVGYIYSILQAFIFAVVPILLIAVLIPGFGGVILKNYGQILIWLVLWEPLLAVINYVIALYAQQGMVDTLSTGGLSMGNITAVTEQTSNFMTAAGFMATMVPMISWGLVKGAMAFTEFISAGVGSSFASSAATGMASGNVSLDSQSMGNKSLGQENLMPKASVGFGQTNGAIAGVGSLISTDFGGTVVSAFGKPIESSGSRSEGVSHTQGASDSVTKARAYEHAAGATTQKILADSQGLGETIGASTRAGVTNDQGTDASISTTVSDKLGAGVKAIMAQVGSEKDASLASAHIAAMLGGAAKSAGVKDGDRAGMMDFIKKHSSGLLSAIKEDPLTAATIAAGILLAIPTGGTSLMAAGAMGAARTLAAVGAKSLSGSAGKALGIAGAGAAAVGLKTNVGGKLETSTNYETSTTATNNSSVERDKDLTKQSQVSLTERELETLARMHEAALQAVSGKQFTDSTTTTDGYTAKTMASHQQALTDTYQRLRSDTDSLTFNRDVTRSYGGNPNALMSDVHGGGSALRNNVDGRLAATGSAAWAGFQSLAGDTAAAGAAADETQGIGRAAIDSRDAKLRVQHGAAVESAENSNGVLNAARENIDGMTVELADAGRRIAVDTDELHDKAYVRANPGESAVNLVTGEDTGRPGGRPNYGFGSGDWWEPTEGVILPSRSSGRTPD